MVIVRFGREEMILALNNMVIVHCFVYGETSLIADPMKFSSFEYELTERRVEPG